MPLIAIGLLGGLVVGMTSVGAGSLMIVLILLLYPTLRAGVAALVIYWFVLFRKSRASRVDKMISSHREVVDEAALE